MYGHTRVVVYLAQGHLLPLLAIFKCVCVCAQRMNNIEHTESRAVCYDQMADRFCTHRGISHLYK